MFHERNEDKTARSGRIALLAGMALRSHHGYVDVVRAVVDNAAKLIGLGA